MPSTQSPSQSLQAPPKRLKYTHEAMIDLIIQEPTVTSAELAEVFGYSAGWVSRILAADSFQSRLAERRNALVNPILARSINERLQGVAIRSMEVIQHRLDTDESPSFALDALGFATQGLAVTAPRKGA